MRERTIISKLVCQDVEAYSDLFEGWTHETVQTEAGNFGYTGHAIELPDLKIFIDHHTRAIRWCEYPHIPVTAIFLPLRCAGEIRWRGHELSATSAVLQGNGAEQHFAIGAHMQAIYFDLSQSLVSNLGWTFLKNGHTTVSPQKRRALVDYCFELITTSPKFQTSEQMLFMRNKVLRLLRDLLLPHLEQHEEEARIETRNLSDFEILLQFEASVLEAGLQQPKTNTELAGQIGISERRLYRAFDAQLGLSPARYLELLRLHALRRSLLAPGNAGTTIADHMSEWGFSNPGRTARRYSELFLEYPKQTVVRAT